MSDTTITPVEETKEETIHRSRVFLDDGLSLAAVASSVTVTTMNNGTKYIDVDLTLVDSNGNKSDFGFWNWETSDGMLVLQRLRDEIDKLIAALASVSD
jgi:hypothetical protein